MRWPWETLKPVHDPTRNYDIFTINLFDSWTYPDLPSYTFPDNFWSQIINIRITIVTVAGIRGATTHIFPTLYHLNRSVFTIKREMSVQSSKTFTIHWCLCSDPFTQRIVALSNSFVLPDLLFTFPNDILTIDGYLLLAGDVMSELSIRIKRWEFY